MALPMIEPRSAITTRAKLRTCWLKLANILTAPPPLDHLLHTNRGQALLTRMHKKEAPMPTLESIMKDFGPVALCKHIADTGHSPVGEHELVAALTTAAVGLHPELSPASAFAKLYAEESVWRACAIAKAVEVANVRPMQVTGEDTRDLSDESEAIAHLKELGRRKWPTATEAQQFANAMTDPKNAALAQRAHRRPGPTTSFPFPR